MSNNKTHYRKVFKSDHLGVADLEEFIEEGKRLIFTVSHVKQEFEVMVAGRKGNHNIAYFKEDIKPLVLNSINSKRMKGFNDGSPFVEDWESTLVELYIDKAVKLMGDIVGGVRISPTKPTTMKPKLNPNSDNWKIAIDYFVGGGDIKKIDGYDITEADLKLLLEKIKEAKTKTEEATNDNS